MVHFVTTNQAEKMLFQPGLRYFMILKLAKTPNLLGVNIPDGKIVTYQGLVVTKEVRFFAGGVRRVILAYPQKVYGILMSGHLTFDPKTETQESGNLFETTEIDDIIYKRNVSIDFSPAGRVRSGTLAGDQLLRSGTWVLLDDAGIVTVMEPPPDAPPTTK